MISCANALPLRPRVWCFGAVFCRPLFGERRQGHFLAGHSFDGNGVNRDHVEARKKPFGRVVSCLPYFAISASQKRVWPLCPRRPVFCRTGSRFGRPDLNHIRSGRSRTPDPARRVQSRCAARARYWSGNASGAGGVYVDFAVHPEVEQRNTIGIAVLAHGCELSAETARQHFASPCSDIMRSARRSWGELMRTSVNASIESASASA